MKAIDMIWKVLRLPCRECGGKGFVIDSDVAAFIETNGLAMYQVATTLMENEIHYGALGSLPCVAWGDLGMSDDQIAEFLEVAHCHVVHSCPDCGRQSNHPSPLETATAVLDKWRDERDRQWAEWQAKRAVYTP